MDPPNGIVPSIVKAYKYQIPRNVFIWFFVVLICLIFFKGLVSLSKDTPFTYFQELVPDLFLAIFISLAVNMINYLVLDFIKERPVVDEYLNHVNNRLQILGITLNDFHQKNEEIIEKLKNKFHPPQTSSSELAYGNKKFQFLLLDPFSKAFTTRADIERKNPIILMLECAKTLKHLDSIIKKLGDEGSLTENRKFEYKFYEIVPSHSLIITDDILWVGPYLVKTPGTESKWFKITSNTTAISQYINEFDLLWDGKWWNAKNNTSEPYSFTKTELIQNPLGPFQQYQDFFLISEYLPSEILLSPAKTSR